MARTRYARALSQLGRGALCVVAFSTVGCGHYFAVQSRLSAGEQSAAGPEIVVRPGRASSRPGRVAVVWPSECANEGSGAQRGDENPASVITSLDCSVEMALVERVLTQNGLDVVHWDTLRRQSLASGSSPDVVAHQLGATLLLRINSFERGSVNPGAGARWERAYFNANARGEVGASVALSPDVADALDALVTASEGDLVAQTRLAVALDVTAVHVPSGEISWLYRWVHFDTIEQESSQLTMLAQCKGAVCTPIRVISAQDAPPPDRGPRAGSVREITITASRNAAAVIYSRLANETVNDLASRLLQLEGPQGAAPTAPASTPAPAAPSARPAPASAPTPTPAPSTEAWPAQPGAAQ